jgi:Polyketide synthase dehydratase N-terminal domain
VINLGPARLTAQCRLPQTDTDREGQFPLGTFQSYVSDVLFQCMVVWVRRFTGAASLPSKVARVEQYGSMPPGRAFFVTVDVKESTQTRMVADVLAHDPAGRIYTRMLDAEVTISKHLNQLFARASS